MYNKILDEIKFDSVVEDIISNETLEEINEEIMNLEECLHEGECDCDRCIAISDSLDLYLEARRRILIEENEDPYLKAQAELEDKFEMEQDLTDWVNKQNIS